MTPTIQFDIAKAVDAYQHYKAVSDHCVNLLTRGPHAITQVKGDIARAKVEAKNPIYSDDVKSAMLKNAANWEGLAAEIALFTSPSKDAQTVAAKLYKALQELKKKPSDKQLMAKFTQCVKDAAASCAKLRAMVPAYKAKLPPNFTGDENMRAFYLLLNALLDYIAQAMPTLAPPRPVQGPPKKS